jgi:hypothetical protein
MADNIRFANVEDAAAVAQLVQEMDRHYRPGEELRPEADYRRVVEETIANLKALDLYLRGMGRDEMSALPVWRSCGLGEICGVYCI